MKRYVIALMLVCSVHVCAMHHAVTYELSPGRFGDNLLSYIHAKWIAYTYDIPLLYKPFVYSDQLLLHERELLYSEVVKNQFDNIVVLGKHVMPQRDENNPTLYIVPYFPESKWELHHCLNFQGKPWDYFEVDWADTGFIAELKKMIMPIHEVQKLKLPKDRVTVAVHVRRGGNHDTPDVPAIFPLKFLSDEFFIGQIKTVYAYFGKPLSVYIFTDDTNPSRIAQTFKNALEGLDIHYGYRMQGNCDTAHVVEDFFAMQQFDCLIHSESNYSFIISKLRNYKMSIYPDSFYKENGKVVYDRINIITNNQKG